MGDLTKLLEKYISGVPGEWYYYIPLERRVLKGGFFYRKADCRRHMRHAIREFLPNYDIACEFFRRKV